MEAVNLVLVVPLALYWTYASPSLVATLWNSSGLAFAGRVLLTFR